MTTENIDKAMTELNKLVEKNTSKHLKNMKKEMTIRQPQKNTQEAKVQLSQEGFEILKNLLQ